MKIHYWCFVILAAGAALAFGQDYMLWIGGASEQEREGPPTGSTKLMFFEEDGAYLADVEVTVLDDSGRQLVDTRSRGPWVVLDLPEGEYDVVANRSNGDAQSARFEVGKGENKEVALQFPDQG